MARSASFLPVGFQWLSPGNRPSPAEVEAYARTITLAERDPPEMAEQHRREAELQLWIWRNETRQRATRSRQRRSPAVAVAAMSTDV